PAGTASLRDFSYIAPEIPEYIPQNCTGCMDCVTECPDTAILGKVLSETELEQKLGIVPDVDREMYKAQWSKTKKYYDAGKKKVGDGGMFQIIIDPSKCKGCAECVTVCDASYPYNPYLVPWTNSLFENAPTYAIGVRMRWDQKGWQNKPLWCIGGDGAMFDIGFQALSRLFASGMNIKVFVLDTQVYSN